MNQKRIFFYVRTYIRVYADRRDYIRQKKGRNYEHPSFLIQCLPERFFSVINYFLVNQTSKEIRFFQYPWSEFEWGLLHTLNFFSYLFSFLFIKKKKLPTKFLFLFSTVLLRYMNAFYAVISNDNAYVLLFLCPALFISINNLNTPSETTNVESLCFPFF